jgi:Protein of unknown function (DUF3558)
MRRVALVAALTAVLGACAAPVAGTPSAAPAVRPREVRLEGVDPCSLLTPAQVEQLRLKGPGLKNPDDRGKSCSWLRFTSPAVGTLVSTVASRGIEAYDTDPRFNDVAAIEARGFPGLQLSFKARDDNCAVVIDVAPGQVLDVQYSTIGADVPISVSDLCAGAHQVAADALDSLLAQR